jgi:TatD DNase family protein
MFVDSHAHIDGEEFDGDRDEVIARARTAGVQAILNVGTGDPHGKAFERAISLAEKQPGVYTAIGVHPHDARLFDEQAAEILRSLLENNRQIVALGEIGLDYHYDNSPRDVQCAVFARQLRMARELDLPVIIHSREAEADTIRILQSEYGKNERAGVMHCFTGGARMAEAAIELDFMVSFAGNVTFKKADELREVARSVPFEKMLIETDCPYLAPVPHRGKRNEPAFVVETARFIAGLRESDTERIGEITSQNFMRLFRIEIGDKLSTLQG